VLIHNDYHDLNKHKRSVFKMVLNTNRKCWVIN